MCIWVSKLTMRLALVWNDLQMYSMDVMFEQSPECQKIFNIWRNPHWHGWPLQYVFSLPWTDVGFDVVGLPATSCAIPLTILLHFGLEDVPDVPQVLSWIEVGEWHFAVEHPLLHAFDGACIVVHKHWSRGQNMVVKVRVTTVTKSNLQLC